MRLALADASIEKVLITLQKQTNSLTKEAAPTTGYLEIPNVVPFVDWDFYYLDGPMIWRPAVGQKLPSISVPKGFVTDLASVPKILWSKYPPSGRYAYAAILHDYLYWFQQGTREEADEVIRMAMGNAAVDNDTVADFYNALRLFGGTAWEKNKEARNKGEKRVLSRFPSDRLISWATWKNTPDVFK